jgi:hypothetical protein
MRTVLVSLALLVGLAACTDAEREAVRTISEDDQFVVRIICSSGLQFTGTYMVVTTAGTSQTGELNGPCPKDRIVQVAVKGTIVSATAQKSEEQGGLALLILKGGAIVAESKVTQPYGVATAASQ